MKVGDYVTKEDKIFLRVVAVIENDDVLLGIESIKEDYIVWYTEQELINHGYTKQIPKWEEFNNAVVGDIISTGSDQYIKIIARVGDAILCSEPASQQAQDVLKMLREKPKSGVKVKVGFFGKGGKKDRVEGMERLRLHASTTKMQHIAGSWFTTKQMVLFNWHLVRE